MKDKIKELEQLNKVNKNKKFYHAQKNMTTGYRAKSNTIRDANGNLMKDEITILERWAEYYDELLNKNVQDQNSEEIIAIEEEVPAPTLQEVETTNKETTKLQESTKY